MLNDVEIVVKLRVEARERAGEPIREAYSGVEQVSPQTSMLLEALPARSAVKYYSAESIQPAFLDQLRGELKKIDEALWPHEANAQALRYFIAASRVDGLESGIYELTPNGSKLIAIFAPGEGLGSMVLQPEFADAAAILLTVGSLRSALESRGAHGHRILLSRAGAACEYAWLTAIAAGYSASIFAGFLPSALRFKLGLDGFEASQLLALAVGHALNEGA